MRFMMMIKSDAQSEAGILPDEKLLAAMGEYNEELVKAGVLLGGEGLQASSKGSRVRIAGQKVSVLDGPFAESKELVAGFWIIEVKSKQEAIDWAKRVPTQGEIEVRQIFELSDFPVDPKESPDGWRVQEQAFRDAVDPKAASPAAPKRKPGTTRFMIIHKGSKESESGLLPSESNLAEMGALIEEQNQAGALLAAEGLQPSSKGARVRTVGSERVVMDGPFTETKELVAGYSIIQVKSKDEAIAFAKRCIRVLPEGVTEGEIEVRQVFDLEDFPVDPAEKKDGWRQKEQEFRDRAGH